MECVISGKSELVARHTEMSGLPTEAAEEREIPMRGDDKTCVPKDDDEVSISSISAWSAFNSDAESMMDGDTSSLHHTSDPMDLGKVQNADHAPADATTSRSEDTTSRGELPPRSRQISSKHRRPTESHSPRVLEPYSTTMSELDRARRQCQSEMTKILQEASRLCSLARTMDTDQGPVRLIRCHRTPVLYIT